jgi:hypothetical protein
MDEDIPAGRSGIGVFFLAAETVAQGVVFFDDDGDRWEVVSKPVPALRLALRASYVADSLARHAYIRTMFDRLSGVHPLAGVQ